MSHFVRTFPDATWTGPGFVVPPAAFETFEHKLTAAVNGEGGAYAPSTTISIGGAGLTARPVVVRGAKGRLRVATNGAFVLVSGLPRLGEGHPGRSRICLTPCIIGWAVPERTTFLNRALCSPQFFGTQLLDGSGPTIRSQMYVPLRVFDGARIERAVLTFRVALPHTTPPTTTVTMRVLRMDASGYTAPLTSRSAGADGDGFVSFAPAPTSGSTWFDGGAVKELSIVCDQNNRVDLAQYSFVAHIVDEQGSMDSPFTINRLRSVASLSRYKNYSLGPYYASSIPAGMRILLTSQTNPLENGLWKFAPHTPPTGEQDSFFVPALDGAGDPRPALVTVEGSESHGAYTRWYLPAPGVPKEPGTIPQRWTPEPEQTGGNIFHAVALHHTGIEHLGFA